jgi:hypothetical protein
MRKIATTTMVGLALAFSASAAAAQMCNGTAPFSVGKMRVGVGLSFPSNVNQYDAEFAYGAASGLYGGVTASILKPSGSTESATVFGINGGKEMTAGTKKNIAMCPQLLVGFGSYPGDVSTLDLGGGVTFATKLDASKSFDLIPFGGAFLVRNSVSVGGASGSDTNLGLTLGAGFVFNKIWSVRPSFSIPLTADGADNVLSIMGSMNFGGKP